MTKNRQMTAGEGALLGLTALFLCVLFAVNAHDAGSAIRLAAAADLSTAAADTSKTNRAGDMPADRDQALEDSPSTVWETVPPERTAAENAGKLDLNAATAEELETLPGIGPALAERIASYRREHGPFPSIEAVTEVSGIGPGKFSAMEPYIYVTP